MSRMLHRSGLVPAHAHIMLIVGVTFLALLVSAALRATPGVLMMPLQLHFGWDRATISFSAAVGIFLYGLVGPFAAASAKPNTLRRSHRHGRRSTRPTARSVRIPRRGIRPARPRYRCYWQFHR